MQYKDVTGGIFEDIARNELVMCVFVAPVSCTRPQSNLFLLILLCSFGLAFDRRIQPSEAIYLKMNAKTPGLATRAMPTELDLTYKRRFSDTAIPEAYEALILDAFKGDHSNCGFDSGCLKKSNKNRDSDLGTFRHLFLFSRA